MASACAVKERDFGGNGGAGAGPIDVTSTQSGGGFFMDSSVGPGPGGQVGSTGTTTPGNCDGSSICGVVENTGCAVCSTVGAGRCVEPYNTCFGTMNFVCDSYLGCLSDCFNTGNPNFCVSDCTSKNPEGAALYQKLLGCIYCDACRMDCQFDQKNDPTFQGCF